VGGHSDSQNTQCQKERDDPSAGSALTLLTDARQIMNPMKQRLAMVRIPREFMSAPFVAEFVRIRMNTSEFTNSATTRGYG
jgi:hypothetical protein